MKKTFFERLIIGIALFLIVSGCVEVISEVSEYSDEYVHDEKMGLDYMAATSPEDLCKMGFCECFVCRNGTSWFLFKTSLAGGQCMFDKECNKETFDDYRKPGSEYGPRYFMIGTGPTFADWGAANNYCNEGLTMAVHWLIGDASRPYNLPDLAQTHCLLQNGVIPVFVLYSKGEDIDIERTAEIARILGNDARVLTMGRLDGAIGPVIITTELEYDGNDPEEVDKVVEQIKVINDVCNNYVDDPSNPEINCFVAVAPKMGNKTALDAVMNHPNLDRKHVHLLAFGINSHYDNGTCDGTRMRLQANEFARYGLYNYSLPSVIPYVLFDANTKDMTGECYWNESEVQDGYSDFFPKGVNELLGAGVIGVSLYDFNTSITGDDPLKCHDCALGKRDDRLASWYGGCQKFIAITATQQSGHMPIIFPNESGGYCDYGVQDDSIFHMYRDQQGQEFYLPTVHKLSTPVYDEPMIKCDACIIQTNKSASDYFEIIEDYHRDVNSLNAEIKEEWCPDCEDPAVCYIFPQIDHYASIFSIDPMFMRAIVWTESGFDPCAMAKVCRDSMSEGCLDGKYPAGYNEMYDPDGKCDTTAEFADDAHEERPEWRFAGLGLFQVMESPYTFWPGEVYDDMFDAVKYDEDTRPGGRRENIDGAKACSETFNPFNPSDAACMGGRKLSGTFTKSKEWVDKYNKNEDCPDLFGIGDDTSKRDILAAFVAAYRYTGAWSDGYDPYCDDKKPVECWADAYCNVTATKCVLESGSCVNVEGPLGCKLSGGRCVPDDDCQDKVGDDKERNFLAYSHCIIEDHEITDKLSIYAGFKKLGAYDTLTENCPNNYCPPWKKTAELLGMNIEDEKGIAVDENFDPDDPYAIYGEPSEEEED